MLGAVATAPVADVSIPPRFHERKDWVTSVRLLEACVMTHDTDYSFRKKPFDIDTSEGVVSIRPAKPTGPRVEIVPCEIRRGERL